MSIDKIHQENEEQYNTRFKNLERAGIIEYKNRTFQISRNYAEKVGNYGTLMIGKADFNELRFAALFFALCDYFIPDTMADAIKYMNIIILREGNNYLYDPNVKNKEYEHLFKIIKKDKKV